MRIVIALIILFLVSCGQGLRKPEMLTDKSSNPVSLSAKSCSCTNAEAPVCALSTSGYVTLINSCVAQCNKLNYTNGACTAGSCNLKSGRICGQPPMPVCPPGNMCIQRMPDPAWYENECLLIRANASVLASVRCNQSSQF